MRLAVAHKAGRLLEYIEGDQFISTIETIDKRGDFLFVLLARPWFDDTRRLGEMLAGS